MDGGIIAVAAMLLLGAGLLSATLGDRARHRRSEAEWRRTAEELGLQYSQLEAGGTLTGWLRGLEVTARGGLLGSGDRQYWATEIEVSGHVSRKLRLGADGKLVLGAVFRAVDALQADEQHAMAAAVLTRSVRSRVDALGARIVDGVVSVSRTEPLESAETIVRLIRDVVELARALSTEGIDVAERLWANVQSETMPDIRDHNHRLLLRCYPETPAGARAMELAAGSSDPAIRLLRARQLTDDRKLEELRLLAEAEGVRTRYRTEAIAELGALDDARVADILRGLLSDRDRDVRRAAIRTAARTRRGQLLEALARCAGDADDATALELARAFGHAADPIGEAALIAYLKRDQAELRGAAIEALERTGTVKAVPALRSLADDGDRQARAAIDTIQARLGDPEAGQLTLVSPGADVGELSVADEGGDLSLAHDARRDRDR